MDNAIETTTSSLSVRAGAGGVNVLESDDLAVDDAVASVNQVKADGTLEAVNDATQSDVVTTGGAAVLRSQGGDIALNDGSAPADMTSVATGGGNIRIESVDAAKNVAVNAAVDAAGGHLTALAGNNLNLNADVQTSGTGTIDLEALNGAATMADGATAQTDGANLRLKAAGDVVIGLIDLRSAADRAATSLAGQAAWGEASIISTGGSILDAASGDDGVTDLFASAARFTAQGSVGAQGAAANPIEIELVTVSADAATGGVNLLDATHLAGGTVGTVPVERVLVDGTTMINADAAPQTGARKGGDANIVLIDNDTPVTDFPTFEVRTTLTNASLPNTYTGLFEQTVRISNPNNSSIDAVRILIDNLPAGVEVYNAAGTQDGRPFLQYNLPLADGQVVDLVIEFYVPIESKIPTAPTFLPTTATPLAAINPVGTVVNDPADQFLIRRIPSGQATVEWNTILGRTYWVEYSDDAGMSWETVLAPVAGTGLKVVWLDNGPPKTDADSASRPARSYRVILQANP